MRLFCLHNMDAVFPLLESAFSKAFGVLTPMTRRSISMIGGGGTSLEHLSSGWTIGIASFMIAHRYENSNLPYFSTNGYHGTMMVIPGTRIGDSNAYCDIKATEISLYTRNASYQTDSISVSIVTFKES